MDTNIIPEETELAKELLSSLMEFYCPAFDFTDSDETKTTKELVEEMGLVEPSLVMKDVYDILKNNGFRIKYNGMAYVWLLKNKIR